MRVIHLWLVLPPAGRAQILFVFFFLLAFGNRLPQLTGRHILTNSMFKKNKKHIFYKAEVMCTDEIPHKTIQRQRKLFVKWQSVFIRSVMCFIRPQERALAAMTMSRRRTCLPLVKESSTRTIWDHCSYRSAWGQSLWSTTLISCPSLCCTSASRSLLTCSW